ncbi:S-layer homology domain-containing protein [Ammoniphilus resinae]|uniref:Membrane protein YgcG n=1 Tax=Ammoniphilus resinae TaxID=861532 RepID=A0ABS4GP27_9BACL|nr:S-layer homology domain-containing protein [Ammoniphilus resinae]MBP1932025.1 putative membrane protein YgcG [Ammoniphilus resinae]
MKKRIVYKIFNNLLLSGLLALSSFSLSALAATPLADINNSYAKDAIQGLVEKGILNGKGDGKFDPTGKIERQDFAIILAKALNFDVTSAPATATFSDVPNTHYAFKYVEAAAKAGLIKGTGDGTFGIGATLSRQDMAVLFVRALGIEATGKGANLTFSDAGQIADYAKDAVATAVELGLINGMGDGHFNPQNNADRQAVALVASNFLKAQDEISPKIGTVTQIDNKTITVSFTKELLELSPEDLVFIDENGKVITIQNVTLSEDKKSVTIKIENLPSEGKIRVEYKKNKTSNGSFKEIKTEKINPSSPSSGGSSSGGGGGSNDSNDNDNTPVNRSPLVVSGFTDRELLVGSIKYVEIDNHFSDPDGDVLSYSVVSDDVKIVTADVFSENGLNKIKLTPLNQGEATITVKADDKKNGTVSATFRVYVGFSQPVNHDPKFIGDESTEPILLSIGENYLITDDLNSLFSDEDEDDLRYEIISSNEDVVNFYNDGGFFIRAVGEGTASVNVTAYDGNGGEVSVSFNVSVQQTPNQAPTATDIEISGTPQLGQTLNGIYTYSDTENDTQGISTFKWIRADDSTGTNKVAIDGATSSEYTLIAEDVGKYISFEVTPLASTGTLQGTPVESNPVGPIENLAPPTATVSLGSTLPLNVFSSKSPGSIDWENWRLTVDGDVFKSSLINEETIVFGGDFSGLTFNGYSPPGNPFFEQGQNEIILTNVTGTITNLQGQGTITIKGELLSRDSDVTITITTNPVAPDNHAPTVESMIYEQVLTPDVTNSRTFDLTQLFGDEDGDTLEFTATSGSAAFVNVFVNGNDLTLSPGNEAGSTTVTVTANDGKGGVTPYTFTVRTAPLIPNGMIVVRSGDPLYYDLSSFFPGQTQFKVYMGTPDNTFNGPTELNGMVLSLHAIPIYTWVVGADGKAAVFQVVYD